MIVRAILLASLLGATSVAEARFVSQQLAGMHRVCKYENPDYSQRRLRPQVQLTIGIGEPCPARYSPVRAPASPTIPSMATLHGQRRVQGRIECLYQYQGRTYPRSIPLGGHCPFTPHFSN